MKWVQYPNLANSGIDILDQRQVHDPGGNYSQPAQNARARSTKMPTSH
jgi:hypothetical protein